MSNDSSSSSPDLLDTIARIRQEDDRIIFVESVIVIIVSWTLISHIFNIVEVMSTPPLIAEAMYEIVASGSIYEHLIPTMIRTAYGLAATLIIGTALGIVMGMRKWAQLAFQDYVTVGLALPGLFIAVFSAIWFGFSDVTPTVAAMVISFPFLAQNVFGGFKNIDNNLLEMGSAFGSSNRRVLRRIVAPSILPDWFAGVRYSLAIVWKIVTLTELVAAENGIGFVIRRELQTLDFAGATGWTILFVIVILLVEYGILQQLEKRLFAWRRDVSGVVIA